MKKGFLGLILALCLALPLLPAAAEEVYFPGEITKSLFQSAFDAGKIITGDLTMSLDLDSGAFVGDDEASKAQLDAVVSLIKDAKLSFGVGKLQDGLRFELGASLSPEGTNGVSVSGAADITLDGISLESDIISGSKITATWETLLALAGVDSQTSAMILSLRDVDWDAALAEATAQLQTAMTTAAQLVTPYVQTAVDFAAALPIQTETGVAADATHPAAATRITVTFTKDDVRSLITALADQLEQDEQVAPMLDALLAQAAPSDDSVPADTAALCAAIRAEVEGLSGTEPYTLVMGMDENDTLLFAEVTGTLGSGVYFACYPVEDAQHVSLMLISIEDDGTVEYSFSFSASITADNADLSVAQNADILMQMQAVVYDVPVFSMDYTIACQPFTTDDAQPGYQVEGAMNMTAVEDDETVMREIMSLRSEQARTATGGEISKASIVADVYADDVQTSVVATGSMNIEPTEDGFTGLYTISEQMPELGIRDLTFNVALGAREHDASASDALAPLALESATSEDVDALAAQATATLQQKAIQLLAVLPQDVQQMILNAE
ncbi:MAG: hypothetical protein Q4G52_11840 [Clostridia bacterium]|nr:hypothetical protein [Clostridia bacterium]